MNIKKHIISVIALASLSFGNVNAADEVSVNENAVILEGYDAVAYFTEDKPTKGSPEFTAVHDNAIYQFSSAANRDTFKADPIKYAPQFGGFCAFGTIFSQKVAIDPNNFEVVDGKLYVNSGPGHDRWLKDIPGSISSANPVWDKIKSVKISDL